jgi:outer membrane murein-binding lipoprotein Lpp
VIIHFGNSRRLLLPGVAAIFAALAFSGCATRPKTYHAPDATKFNAASKKLEANIEKTGATIELAQARVSAAQKNYDEVATASIDVRDRVVALAKVVPPEILPEVNQLLTVVEEKIRKEGELSENLKGAYSEIEQAKKFNADSATFKAEVQSHFETYQRGAIQNATDATDERNKRIVAEKKVIQQKIFRWLWRIGGGVIILSIIGLFILWLLGKWTVKGVVTAAKVYVGR